MNISLFYYIIIKFFYNMNKVEIDGKLDKSWVISLLAEGYTTYDIVVNYEVSEDLILECSEFLDKNVIIQGMSFSEDFVTKAIEIEYFHLDDIKELSMSTYANLSPEFISKYKEHINWNRMILYVSTQSNSFDEYVEVINDKDLWQVISANDLPLEFIRDYKDNLDWSYLSMVKCFTDEEKEEFVDYILTPVQKEIGDESFINQNDLKFTDKMTDEELEDLINEISKHISK